MLFKLILLFMLMPVLELALLLKINSYVGLGYTLLIVVSTGILGAYFTRQQGRGILQNIKFEMSQGRMPGDELINGLCVLIGGVMLFTPGLLTDTAGFLLVFPATRNWMKDYVKGKIKHMLMEGTFTFFYRR